MDIPVNNLLSEILALHSVLYYTQGNPFYLTKEYVKAMEGRVVRKRFFKTIGPKFAIVKKHPYNLYKFILSNMFGADISVRIEYDIQIDYIVSMMYAVDHFKSFKKALLIYGDVDKYFLSGFRNVLVKYMSKNKLHSVSYSDLKHTVPNSDFYSIFYKTILEDRVLGGSDSDNNDAMKYGYRVIIRDGVREDKVPMNEQGFFLPFYDYYVDILTDNNRVKIMCVLNYLKMTYRV